MGNFGPGIKIRWGGDLLFWIFSLKAKVTLASIQEATQSDIVITTTPSREPIIRRAYIRPGTHINAIGADAEGKQELEPDLLKSAKIIVDDITQASYSGEINVPLSKGFIDAADIYSTLGEIVANHKKGRENDEEITIFDSTGLAIQDVACANLVYQKAEKEKIHALDFL